MRRLLIHAIAGQLDSRTVVNLAKVLRGFTTRHRLLPFCLSLSTALLAALVGLGTGCGGSKGESVFSISPTSATVTCSDFSTQDHPTVTFTARVDGTITTNVRWEVQEAGGGFFGGDAGVYIASNTPGVYHVLATNLSNMSQKASATVTCVARPNPAFNGPSVVNPDTSGISFSAQDQPGCSFYWTVTGAMLRTGQGTYSITVDTTDTESFSITCVVTNQAGTQAKSTTTLRLVPPPSATGFSESPESILPTSDPGRE